MITIKSKKRDFGINFPTDVKEITKEHLDIITSNVKLPKHYCIVALCFKTNIFEFVATVRGNKNSNMAVTPIMAKISEEDSNLMNICVGDKLIVDRTSLERGNHLYLPVSISSESASRYFNSDPDLIKSIMNKDNSVLVDTNTSKSLAAVNSPEIIILEFKIIAINDIHGATTSTSIADPFIVREVANN